MLEKIPVFGNTTIRRNFRDEILQTTSPCELLLPQFPQTVVAVVEIGALPLQGECLFAETRSMA